VATPVYQRRESIKGTGEELNCWNLGSLGARKNVLMAEKKKSRVAPKHFTFLKFTYSL